jgi:hypothetical protein
MRDCSLRIFLTFVLMTGLSFQSKAAPVDELERTIKKEPIGTVHDPALTYPELRRVGKYVVQANLGWLAGHVTKKLDQGSHTAYGLTYDWLDLDQNFWSVTARWLSSQALWLEAGKKFMIQTETDFEPYYKLSLSHFMDPDDSLAGLTRINSFKASASVGLLDMWALGRIFSFELGTHWGLDGLAFHAQVGLQWSF